MEGAMGRIFVVMALLAAMAADADAAPVTLRLLTDGGQTERVSATVAAVEVLGFDADEERACIKLKATGRTTWAVREMWMRPTRTSPTAPKIDAGKVAGPGNGMGPLGGPTTPLQNCP